jgi:LysR family transcriptional regulator, transcriptional activator of the cysJI operon
MNLRHLRIFRNLCETMNMTRTAENLFMTQPSVSQAIAELESHFQVRLFDRIGRNLYLTDDGKFLLTRTRDLLSYISDTEEYFSRMKIQKSVKIGASATIGSYIMPDLILGLQKRIPDLHTRFVVDNTTELENALLKAELDMALVEGNIHSQLLKAVPLRKDQLVLVSHKRLLQNKKKISADDLRTLPFLMREEGSGTVERVRTALQQWGIHPLISGTASSIDCLYRMALAGLGVTYLPLLAVEKDLKKGKLVEIRFPGSRLVRGFQLVYHSGKKLEEHIQLIMNSITEMVQD